MALTDNLQLFMEFESGALTTDATGTNTAFTNNNAATSVTGKVGNAVNLVLATGQWLSHAANASLQVGDIDFTVACWVKFTTLPGIGNQRAIAGQGQQFSGVQRAWNLDVLDTGGAPRARFVIYANGTTVSATVVANTFGNLSTGVWYYVLAYHDSVNNVIGISIDGGARDTAVASAGVFTSTADFLIGKTVMDGVGFAHDGLVDQFGFFKRVVGTTDNTALVNSGNGLTYTQMQALTLSGIAAIGSAGNVAASTQIGLSGNQAATAVGSVASSAQKSITGVVAAGQVGSVTSQITAQPGDIIQIDFFDEEIVF